MKLKRTWVFLVGLLLIVADLALARTWTSSNGKFSIEADLVEIKDEQVRLKTTNGKIIAVAVSKLSKADQDYLASIAQEKDTEAGGKVVDRYAGGQVKAEYTTNSDGQKTGAYVEYYESGVVKIRANYLDGQLDGKFVQYHPNKRVSLQATYRIGKLQGSYVEFGETGKITRKTGYLDGQLHGLDQKLDGKVVVSQQSFKHGELALQGITPSEIRRRLEEIGSAKLNGPGTENMKTELRRLICYRFLCGVPYERMELDNQMNLEAECAAKVCEGLGDLTHNPDRNPGLPQDVFELGKKGCARSNLWQGGLLESIDQYMSDSDPSNIDVVGHRRFCLNPDMQKVGFGESGEYTAMWVMDKSSSATDWQAVAYPPRGYMPVEFFRPWDAWSISFNHTYWVVHEANALTVSIRPEGTEDMGPLELDHVSVDISGNFLADPCVIFRPKKIELAPGSRYRVTIDGITTRKGQPKQISYLVAFM